MKVYICMLFTILFVSCSGTKDNSTHKEKIEGEYEFAELRTWDGEPVRNIDVLIFAFSQTGTQISLFATGKGTDRFTWQDDYTIYPVTWKREGDIIRLSHDSLGDMDARLEIKQLGKTRAKYILEVKREISGQEFRCIYHKYETIK